MQFAGSSIVVLFLTAAAAAAEPIALRLEKGQELAWRGTFEEETIRPGVRNTRNFEWEARVLITERSADEGRFVIFTRMRLQPEAKAKGPEPTAVTHIEYCSISATGRVALLPPVALLDPNSKLDAAPIPPAALDGLPLLETCMFLEMPGASIASGQTWDLAEKNRPFRTWCVEGEESTRGARCFKIAGTQESPGWKVRRGNDAAWRRLDTIWVSVVNGYAARFERLLERRDAESQEINLRTKLTAEQAQRLNFRGASFEDRRIEAAQALYCRAAMDRLTRDPAQAGASAFDALARRIAAHETARPAGESIPYREALIAVRRRAEAAKRGQFAPLPFSTEEAAEPAGQLVPNCPAPDFVATRLNGDGDVRLYRLLGRPVVLLYYQPSADSAEPLLRFAEQLHTDPTRRASVLAIALGDVVAARKQARLLGLTVPVLAGDEIVKAHGIESTPQAAVLDAEGAVKRVLVGWGAETVDLILREVEGRKQR